MRTIGLTGGIACGKSNVSDMLRSLGAYIVDGDELSRRLTAPGGAALPAIRAAFGNDVFAMDGTLDRRGLGAIVFGSNAARQQLDNIMQPMLLTLIRSEMRHAEEAGADICVLDMPLLYEKELETLCDTIWCVYIPRAMQLERLMARDGFDLGQAESRLASQLPASEKAERADVVIDTSGTIEQTRSLIPALYQAELIH